MGGVHVYTVPHQPATRYKIGLLIDDEHVVRNSPRTLFWCFHCGRKRWAKNMTVQVYYDGCYFWCRNKEACKAAKKARRRSR